MRKYWVRVWKLGDTELLEENVLTEEEFKNYLKNIENAKRIYNTEEDKKKFERLNRGYIRYNRSPLRGSLNIYPIKGYSITYHHETDAPTTSVLDDDAKIVASPFSNNTFRVAGTAELAGWNHEVRKDRIEPLRKWVRNNTFVKDERPEEWACLRPMTPNMLPIITKSKGLWVNSGAGHLGWTMGMALAERLVNDLSSR